MNKRQVPKSGQSWKETLQARRHALALLKRERQTSILKAGMVALKTEGWP